MSENSSRIDELEDRCRALQHAIQSGVKAWQENNISNETEPKHLRVGINSAMCDHGALVKLLLDAGLIDLEKYLLARIEMLERDVRSYEQRLSAYFGNRVTLG